MNTVNVNLKLDKKTEKLFQELEANSGVEKAEIISGILSGENNLEDLRILNGILKREKKYPNPKTYTHEQIGKRLGFI